MHTRSRAVRVAAVLVGLVLAAEGCSSGSGDEDRDRAPSSDAVLVALALEVDADGLAAAAAATAPSGSSPGQFRSLADVASSYGASEDEVDDAIRALSQRGVDVEADPTRGVLWGEVEVGTAEDVFGVELDVTEGAGGRSVIRPRGTPRVPDGVDGVAGVIGLVGAVGTGASTTTGPGTTAPVPSCPGGEISPSALGARYGVEALVDAGLTGDGVTVGLLETEAFDPRVFDVYDACTDGSRLAVDVSTTEIPLAAPPRPGNEAELDVIALGLLAPDAALRITRFDPETSVVFPVVGVLADAAATGATPDVFLSTVGFCEDDVTDTEVAATEWLLAALAATGTTTIAASGDLGSTSCHPQTDAPAVQYPSSSAWSTAVGGASFGGVASAPSALRVWNDTPDADAAGGGGTSTKVARPTWQRGSDQPGDHRLVPDVAAFAPPGGVGAVPTCTGASCEWRRLGGTSLAAAAVAGGVALGVQHRAEGGGTGRLGHLAPVVVEAANGEAGVVTDVTRGNNHVYTDACCAATPGYDTASGWGVADLSGLLR